MHYLDIFFVHVCIYIRNFRLIMSEKFLIFYNNFYAYLCFVVYFLEFRNANAYPALVDLIM